MRKTTHFSRLAVVLLTAMMLLPLSINSWAQAPSPITWTQGDLPSINSDNSPENVGNITVSVAANCWIGSTPNLYVENGGSITFSTTLGNFKVITISYEHPEWVGYNVVDNLGTGWTDNSGSIKWTGDASSVTLATNGSGDITLGSITSIVFSFEEEPVPTITWEERQISHVSMDLYSSYSSVNDIKTTPVIKNVIASLERTSASNDNCDFAWNSIHIEDNGDLTFQSIVGDFTQIVITSGAQITASDLPADWTYNSSEETLTWEGTPSSTVTLSGNISCNNISSIVFNYNPAAAPEVGTIFYGSYNQQYEITGAHTAKVAVQDIDGTLTIPESAEYNSVTYYITEIAENAFKDKLNISNVLGGENIAIIGAHAFDGCYRMEDFDLDSKVLDEIGDEAFKGCKLLMWVRFQTTTPPTLGTNAFSGDNYLYHIQVPYDYVYDYVADYKAATNWSAYSSIIEQNYSAPQVGQEFFYSNQTTTNLFAVTSTSPKEAKVIQYTAEINAIYPVTNEGTLIIPELVRYMSSPYDITGIGANAYKDNTLVTTVMIPEAVKTIEAGAFLGCTGVEKVYFLWDDLTGITWADGAAGQGLDFKTAASGETKIFVPADKLDEYKAWAPAWASCMVGGKLWDVSATEDPEHTGRYYRTFYDSQTDYIMPPSVWAHAGYVENGEFILSPVAFDGQILPRGTAVVLESETSTYRLIPTGTNDAPLYTGRNDLTGTDVDILRSSLGADADRVYVLNQEATIGGQRQVGMGMYRYTGTTLGAHKAYYVPSPSSPAPKRFLFKHEDSATGIDNTNANVQSTKLLRDGQLIIIRGDKEFNAQGQVLK